MTRRDVIGVCLALAPILILLTGLQWWAYAVTPDYTWRSAGVLVISATLAAIVISALGIWWVAKFFSWWHGDDV